jgi:protein-S-isoprenylcysteine O-methyltransferase Ste14
MRREFSSKVTELLLAALFVVLACGALSTAARTGAIAPLLSAMHESAVAVLILCRRPATTPLAQRAGAAVALAWTGTLLPLLLRSDGTQLGFSALGGVLQSVGVVLALVATLMLGRSFDVVAANRGVRVRGLYRVVRHPIYAAYLLAVTGVVLSHPSPSNVAVLLIWTAIQARRTLAEERVLQSDPAYRRYAARVRYRLIPGLW